MMKLTKTKAVPACLATPFDAKHPLPKVPLILTQIME
jgi:hypothetical protein